LSGNTNIRISDDHQSAVEGWRVRKEQLHRQQKAVTKINEDAEKIRVLFLSKRKTN